MDIQLEYLKIGQITNDKNWNVAMHQYATVLDPNPTPIMVTVPMVSVLIRHPTEGNILYDMGAHTSTKLDPIVQAKFPAEIRREDYLDEKLKSIGLSVHDISTLIVSHMHWDHAEGLKFFANTPAAKNIYVGYDDFQESLVSTHRCALEDPDNYYKRGTSDVEGAHFHLLQEQGVFEIMPGIEGFIARGHTPGVLGLIVHAKENTYILPGDTLYMAENFGPPARKSGIQYDSFAFDKSAAMIHALQKKYNAKMIYPHDPDQAAELLATSTILV